MNGDSLQLSPGCWVGRSGSDLLIAVDAQYFVVEDPATADVIEAFLHSGGGRDSEGAEALLALGLLTTARHGDTLPNAHLAEAVLRILSGRGIDCEIASQTGSRRDSQTRLPAGLLQFATGPTSVAPVAAAVGDAAGAGVPLVTVLRVGNDLAVSPALRPGGSGCGHCLWLRHAATLPWPAAAVLAPGHHVVAESLDCWPAELIPELARALTDAVEAVLCRSAADVLRLRTSTISATQHVLLPRPDCPVCAGGQRPELVAIHSDPAQDPWCGLVTSYTEGAAVGGLRSVIAQGVLPLHADGTPSAAKADLSRGISEDYDVAWARARGEALERHAARSPQFEEVRTRPPAGAETLTQAELWPGPAPDTRQAAGNKNQPARPAADADQLTSWVRATWLDGGEVWVPKPAMVIGGGPPGGNLQITSNGVAAGPSIEYSRLRAVAELLERDAVLTTWVHRRPAVRLPITDDKTDSLAAALAAEGVKVSLWQLDGAAAVPVVMAVARGNGSSHLALTLGAACDTCVDVAAAQAMAELASNVVSAAQEIRDGALTAVDAEAVRGIDDHAAYYLNPLAGSALDFLFQHRDKAAAPGHRPEQPANIIETCRAARLRIATCDITPPDVAACGIYVMRAISPDLVPLWFGWHREPIRHPRLRCRHPNRMPHPFR